MIKALSIVLPAAALALASCIDSPVLPAASHGSLVHARLPQGATDGGGASVAVAATVDGAGATTGRLSGGSSATQTLTADTASGIGRAALTFPPGTVPIDLDVGLTAGVPVATAEMAQELGLAQPGAIVAAGPSVLVSVSAPLAGTVTLSLPLDQSLALADEPEKLQRLIVIYRIVKDGKTIAGFLPRTTFVLENGIALVPIGAGGLYQLGYAAIVETVAKAVETKLPVQSNVEAKKTTEQAQTDQAQTSVATVVGWELVEHSADHASRQLKVTAKHSGNVRACRLEAELYTPDGLVTDAREVGSPQALLTITPLVTVKVRARFRCFDDAGKETISPWSDAVVFEERCHDYLARDADGDGYFVPAPGRICGVPGLPAGYTMTPVSLPDCHDGDASLYAMVSLFPDVDNDGYGVAPGVPVCAGSGVPPGFASLPGDCDAADDTKWQLLSLYVDADNDGYGVGALAPVCSGATPPAGYAAVDGDSFPNDPLLHGFGAFLGAIASSANDAVVDVREDSAGNRYYLMNFGSPSVDADPTSGIATVNHTGQLGTLVTKVSASGSYAWTRSFTGSGVQGVSSENLRIAPDDTIVVAGSFFGTIDFDGAGAIAPRTSNDNSGAWADGPETFVLKLDASGNVLWVHNSNHAGDDLPYGLAVAPSGEIYVGGYFFNYPIDLNPTGAGGDHTSNGGQDCYLLKLDANGNYVTSVAFGGSGNDAVNALDLAADGKIWSIGRFEGSIDFDFSPRIDIRNSAGGQDIFILRTSDLFASEGLLHLEGSGDDRGNLIATDPRGGVVAYGHFTSASLNLNPSGAPSTVVRTGVKDMWVASYDGSMSLRWGGILNTATVSPTDISSGGLAVAADGSTYLSGWSTRTIDFDLGAAGVVSNGMGGLTDLFLLRVTPNGSLDWFRTYGETNRDVFGAKLTLTPGGSLVMSVAFANGTVNANFLDGAIPLAPGGAKDGFAVQFD